MSDAQISRAAALFATLAEPSRLRLLQSLLGGSTLTVTELVAATGLSQANVSKHLSVLHSARLVSKTRDGIFVKYEIADNLVSQLCALVCSKMERDLLDDAKALGQ
jgi:DNA-binding transcriptional ArsR family regulator